MDQTYAELMAIYDEMTAHLDSEVPDVEELADLLDRAVVLGQQFDRESEQMWALWMARNTKEVDR